MLLNSKVWIASSSSAEVNVCVCVLPTSRHSSLVHKVYYWLDRLLASRVNRCPTVFCFDLGRQGQCGVEGCDAIWSDINGRSKAAVLKPAWVCRTTQNIKKENNWKCKPLSRISRSSTIREGSPWWVLDGRLWWKRFVERWVLTLEWNSECIMEGESGEHVEDELEWIASLDRKFWSNSNCKVDVMRQEVDSREEVTDSEMSDWWFFWEDAGDRYTEATDKERVPRWVEQRSSETCYVH